MPCVNLANIRTYRSSLKLKKNHKNKAILGKITEQKIEKVNEENLAKTCLTQDPECSTAITTEATKRNAPIRRMQFGMPLMTHAEIKEAKATRRFQHKLTKQATKNAKRLAKQTAKSQNVPEEAKPSHYDEPILLNDGDVIKIYHTRKPLNFIYEPVKSATPTVEQVGAPVAATASQPTSAQQNVIQEQHVVYVPSLRKHPSRAELINAESRIGSQIFGPIPTGHRREFFHHQRGVWIWHEDWTDEQRKQQELTVRYEVRLSGIYKKIAAGKYLKLEGAELANFRQATHTYLKMIKSYLYQGI